MRQENKISVHQAYYGEINRSHGCIGTSLVDDHLKAILTAFTDRPGTIPPGQPPSPYYSGGFFENFYAFTLTFPDAQASRGGMVFTHVLLISREDIEDVNNLEYLFKNFIGEIPENRGSLSNLELDRILLKSKDTTAYFPLYIQQVVNKLVSAEFPISFCGTQESFKEVICAVWRGLPVAFRTKFSYTAGFSVNNMDHSKTFIHFQKSLQSILKSISFISHENNAPTQIINPVERYLLQADSDNTFENFLTNIQIQIKDWSLLKICVAAFQSYCKLGEEVDASEVKLLMRSLAKLNPNPESAKQIKEAVLTKFCDYINSGKEENIKSLRNLPLEAYENGIKNVSGLIKNKIVDAFKSIDFNVTQLSDLIRHSYDVSENGRNWWIDTIQLALHTVGSSNESLTVANIWAILTSDIEAQATMLQYIPSLPTLEQVFVKQFPAKVPLSLAKALTKQMEKRNWFLLHAHLLLTHSDVETALVKQLEMEERKRGQNGHGVRLILDQLKDEELLNLLLRNPKDRLIEECANKTVNNPSLLAHLDVTNNIWLKLWSASLDKTKSFVHGIQDAPIKVFGVLELIMAEQAVPANIIASIANTRFADISQFPARAKVWNKLPANLKPIFLRATADGYLSHLFKGIHESLEPELNNFIANDNFMTNFLAKSQGNINIVISVYEQINGLKDKFLADYIRHYRGSINTVDESRLGNLIFSGQLILSARAVFEKVRDTGQLKTALALCRSLIKLSIWESFTSGHLLGQRVSPHLVYDALQEVATALYGQGPEDKDVWKRAGGDVSKLHNGKTREENWRHAIDLLKNGGGGKHISLKSIIKEMLEDYPGNSQLKEIKNYFK